MNTKQIKYVLILAREGSFSRAAEALNITQPSFSQYIKKIEKELGLELFDRTNGDVRITDAGRVYIDIGRKILDLEHQMETELSDIAEYRFGSVIIGSSPYRAAGMIPQIAAEFQKHYPGIHLVIREGTTAELAEGMEHGDYDFALTLLPVNERLFSYEKIMEEELVLAVPRSFAPLHAETVPGRRYPVVDAPALDGHRFVMLTDVQFMQQQLENLTLDHKLTVYPAAVVKSLEAQISFVRAGVGMALVPSGVESFCSCEDVAFYSLRDAIPKREVVVLWRKDRALSPIAEELKKVIHTIQW